jgi:hypothetical protein
MYIFVIDFKSTETSKYNFYIGTNMAVPIEMRSFRDFVH